MTKEMLEKAGIFERYRDVDGDGIPYRTLPGTDHPLAAYFTRGSGHNEKAGYTERPDDYVNLMNRLLKKLETAKKHIPQPVVDKKDNAKVGIIAFGSSDYAIGESRDQMQTANLPTSYLRLRALPLTDDVKSFIASHERTYVVEQNRDGQLKDMIVAEYPELATKIRSVRHFDGLPLDARFVTDAITSQEK
jgi:2-oxoglutarate/2-oxoacid ferredoxin oxidoreductase subunit alpha